MDEQFVIKKKEAIARLRAQAQELEENGDLLGAAMALAQIPLIAAHTGNNLTTKE